MATPKIVVDTDNGKLAAILAALAITHIVIPRGHRRTGHRVSGLQSRDESSINRAVTFDINYDDVDADTIIDGFESSMAITIQAGLRPEIRNIVNGQTITADASDYGRKRPRNNRAAVTRILETMPESERDAWIDERIAERVARRTAATNTG